MTTLIFALITFFSPVNADDGVNIETDIQIQEISDVQDVEMYVTGSRRTGRRI